MFSCTLEVSEGDLDGGSGLGKVIQRWDAEQATSGLLIFMPVLFHRYDKLSAIYRIKGALEMTTQ